jgi:hypothetical protein
MQHFKIISKRKGPQHNYKIFHETTSEIEGYVQEQTVERLAGEFDKFMKWAESKGFSILTNFETRELFREYVEKNLKPQCDASKVHESLIN